MFGFSTDAPHVQRELRTCALLFLFVIGLAGAALAQCPTPDKDPNFITGRPGPVQKSPDDDPLLPEAGFLTNTHYTSQFFGFTFDLPLTVQGHEIMMPVMPEKQHALLALQYEKGDRNGYIMVTASDPRPGEQINLPDKQEDELERWNNAGLYGGINPTPVPRFMLRSGQHFYSSTHRSGRNYAAQYWAGINNYMVKVIIGTNDEEFLRKAKDLMAEARFYCPQPDGTLITAEGKPVKPEGHAYQGPTVPTLFVNAAIREEPGKDIPPGKLSDGVYRNPELGLQYQLPRGWETVSAGQADPPIEPGSLRVYRFLHACSRTLLEIAPHRNPGAGGEPSSNIVLRALDPDCLALQTAASLTDKRAADSVAASLEEMDEFGQIASDELVSIHGHLFMIFHGTFSTSQRTEDLGLRMSQTIFATRYNKYLLMWSVLAPNRDALAEVPTSNILFNGSPPIQLRASLETKK